jgi:phosphatidate cytidylyltransferase
MKRVLTALILIPVALGLVFFTSRFQWIFTLAVAAIAALAGWEILGLAQRGGARPPRVAVLVALVALFAGNFFWPDGTALIFGILCLGLLLYCTFSRPVDQMVADSAASIFCMFYAGYTLLALPALHEQANGPSLVVFLLFVVWAGDIAALYTGRAWGKAKMARTISPNKTWAGAVGSMAASLLTACALIVLANYLQEHDSVVLSYPDDFLYWLGLAAVVNVAAQTGDLFESALKRSAGVKDSGDLLPGHGGMLDRIDALLVAAPALLYAEMIYQRF